MLRVLSIIFLLVFCLQNGISRYVEMNEISAVLKLLVDRGQITQTTQRTLFGHFNTVATGQQQDISSAATNAILDVTVNGVVHSLSISSSSPAFIDRAAARFCIATGVVVENCILIRDSLLNIAQENNLSRLRLDSTIQGHILHPDPSRWQFTEQRVYFNITVSPSKINVSNLCYYVDFGVEPQHCESPQILTTELTYLPRPSFTRIGFQRGWHSLTVQPESMVYSPDIRFFYVAEPSVEIMSASLQHYEKNDQQSSYMIRARIKVADFRLGIDGKYCLLLDWQVVSCISSFAPTNHTIAKSNMLVQQIDREVLTHVEDDGKTSGTVSIIDLEMNHASHRSCRTATHTIAIVLMSIEHHSKAVAVSPSYSVKIPSVNDQQKSLLRTKRIKPDVALPLLQSSEWGIWSQNGEDGILLWILSELDILDGQKHSRYFVEFGVEDGYECNTRFLHENFGWNGLLMDGSHENETINLRKEFITAEGINTLFDTHGVPHEIDFLSVDIDFNDFWVLKAIFDEGKYTAKVIAVEYNSHVPSNEARTVKYNATQMWDGATDYFGAGAAAFERLGAANGYRLIFCESHGVNAFLVREDLVDGIHEPLNIVCNNGPNFFGRGLNYPVGNGSNHQWIFPFDTL